MLHHLNVVTRSRVELQNITAKIQQIIDSSGIVNGVCYVFVPHTTAGITLNENADEDVLRDIVDRLASIAPDGSKYHHMEGNGPAHVKSSVVGHSETLLVENGRLILGTWQGVFLCEFDGPRERHLLLRILSD